MALFSSKKPSTLLREISSKIIVIFIVWIVLILIERKTNLSLIKMYMKITISVMMPSEDTQIFEFNQYKKSEKVSFIIYPDLGSLKVRTDGYNNISEKSSTTRVGDHSPSVF